MNVFYEEEGTFKVGGVLADNTTSLQVEAPHGRRSKIKSSSVLIRFESPALAGFMAEAQKAADEIDIDFLWQCCGTEEFGYEALAREYYGHVADAAEAGAVLLSLHAAPMYFYKKGRGRYKAAPADALKAALASVERKKALALRKDLYVEQLLADELPDDFRPLLDALLYKPDKGTVEWKALEEAAAQAKLTPARLLERCGAVPSTHDYHLNRFISEFFPRGTGFPGDPVQAPAAGADLPLAEAAAFSIDDEATTEIDDAFSVVKLPDGGWRVGIHIAAPALEVTAGSDFDAVARERLSTVYFPGGKLTMLPDAAIVRYTLAAGTVCPALSFYTEIAPDFTVVSSATRIERVSIAANLRHETLEAVFNESALASGHIAHEYGEELKFLWDWSQVLSLSRRGGEPEVEQRPEYLFRVAGDRVHIRRRMRGTPIDQVVAEMMIYVNSQWGRDLAQSGTAAIYRVQGNGKVRMSTVPAAHEGLGVEQYSWASSPLRRYIDLVNQRQLIALAGGEAPPYRAADESLLAAMRDFEATYDSYLEFQRNMERYWCLRWLLQENVTVATATVLRDVLVRFDDLPMVARVPSLPPLPSGTQVTLAVSAIDLFELTLHCEYQRKDAEQALALPAATAGEA